MDGDVSHEVSGTSERKLGAALFYRSDEETEKSAPGSQTFIKSAAIRVCDKPANFCDLPSVLQRKITSNLDDEDLWLRRDFNRIFYRSFFEQKVVPDKNFDFTMWGKNAQMSKKFNCDRAIKLANMGRVFKNVEYLIIFERRTMAFPNNLNFPKLRFLDLFDSECTFSSSIQSLRKLRWDRQAPQSRMFHDVFPNIEEMIIDGPPCYPSEIGKFPKLRVVQMIGYIHDWTDILTIENYPLLRKISFYYYGLASYFSYQEDQGGREYADFYAAVRKLRAKGVTVVLPDTDTWKQKLKAWEVQSRNFRFFNIA